jgi:hypothetical protein
MYMKKNKITKAKKRPFLIYHFNLLNLNLDYNEHNTLYMYFDQQGIKLTLKG